jgi:hypothetical protein
LLWQQKLLGIKKCGNYGFWIIVRGESSVKAGFCINNEKILKYNFNYWTDLIRFVLL